MPMQRPWLARLWMLKQTDRTRQADAILFIFFTIPTIQILNLKVDSHGTIISYNLLSRKVI